MTTIPPHIIDQARAADLIELAGRHIDLTNESAASKCGPCPKCQGEDRFWIRDNRYTCRGCGINGDSIDFVRMVTGCDFMEAVAQLTGWNRTGERQIAQAIPTKRVAANKPVAAPNTEWQREKTKLADEGAHRLFTDPQAEPGREYLLGRSIEPHAWQRFHLGYRANVPLPGTWNADKKQYTLPGKPAIALPWYRNGKVWAIRYRFLEAQTYIDAQGKQRKEKQVAQPGSHFAGGLYGGHALPEYTGLKVEHSEGKRAEALRTLVICEGELNAISIWQVAEPWGWDVLSLGSESQKLSQPMIDYAKTFGRVLVWMDRESIVKDLMSLLLPLGFGVSSPHRDDGGKLDANDLLQQGLLGGFLASMRLKSCKSTTERQRFLFDLWDADQRPPYLDAGARRMMSEVSS